MSRNRYKVQDAIQGESGLWIKPALDKAGRRHLFVAETKAGVDGGSHDHYWDNGDGTFGVQLRDQSGTALVVDPKGHLLTHNSSFHASVNSHLSSLFTNYFVTINPSTDNTPQNSGGTAMSGATSIDEQIELLENLKSYLEARQEKLLGLKANYQRKVDALHEEGGLLRDVYESYLNNCLEPTSDMIDSLIDHIGDNDIPAVENWIAKLEELRG